MDVPGSSHEKDFSIHSAFLNYHQTSNGNDMQVPHPPNPECVDKTGTKQFLCGAVHNSAAGLKHPPRRTCGRLMTVSNDDPEAPCTSAPVVPAS